MLRLNDPQAFNSNSFNLQTGGGWSYPKWPNYGIYDRNTHEHNNGIYAKVDQNGVERYYIDLAYSKIKPELAWGEDNDKFQVAGDKYSWSAKTCGRWPYPLALNSNRKCNPNLSYFQSGHTPEKEAKLDFYLNLADTDAHGTNNNDIEYWSLLNSINPDMFDEEDTTYDQTDIVQKLLMKGTMFRFNKGEEDDVVYTIIADAEKRNFVNHTNTEIVQEKYNKWGQDVVDNGCNHSQFLSPFPSWWCGDFRMLSVRNEIHRMSRPWNRRTVYRIQIDYNPLESGKQTNTNNTLPNAIIKEVEGAWNPIEGSGAANNTTQGEIQFVSYKTISSVEEGELQSLSPAIWETESKADNDLDIYYEIDDAFPLEINNDTNYDFAPIGTTFTPNPDIETASTKYTILEWSDNRCRLDKPLTTKHANSWYDTDITKIKFLRPNGSVVKGRFLGLANPISSISGVTGILGTTRSEWIIIDRDVSLYPIRLSWYNCYSFGNGVESDRIRDDYNEVKIDKGPKASSTLDELYEEERRKYGLIYSGIYNSNSGVNNLNQFIAAEKITKDINPTYGSIQKLHARDTDLVTLCEDKCLRILSSKDAVYNADGKPQLVATENVLGQTIPFSGEFGISKNPESFASESYRVYFTDKIRGAVMRLSKDGLTPISMHGMKDWFKDNLKLSNILIGSYDDKKDEYNLTLKRNYSTSVRVQVQSKPRYTYGVHSGTWVSIIDDSTTIA